MTFKNLKEYLWRLTKILAIPVLIILAIPVGIVSRITGWGATTKRTRDEVVRTIEQFIDGTAGEWDWDDFVSVADANPILERARRRCIQIAELFPPEGPRQWCGPRGLDELRQVAHELRQLSWPEQD